MITNAGERNVNFEKSENFCSPAKQRASLEQHRRNKCVVKLAEQIQMAEAEIKGETFGASTPLSKFLLAKLQLSPEQERRNKLGIKLSEQLQMAEAEIKGDTFERMKRAWVTDENGDRKKVERPARLKKWWVKDNAGIIILRVRYGSKAIELQKGKAAVEVGQLNQLPAILKTIKDAVLAGGFCSKIQGWLGRGI